MMEMSYELISRNRKALMGWATLWVALLHSQMWFSFLPLQWIKITGHGGVEMFLFLSAFGLYYAYQKGEHGWNFFRRRILRILPYFLPVVLFRIWYLKEPLDESIRLLTATSFWITGDRSMWFVSALIILYALTPLYLHFFSGREEKMTAWAFGLSAAASFFFLDRLQTIFTASMPVFFLGFLAGYYSKQKKTVDRRAKSLGALLLAAGIVLQVISYANDVNETLLFGKGMFWYPHLLIVWPLCMLLSVFTEWCRRVHWLWLPDMMNHLGAVSLEFYLLHELMMKFWSNIFSVAPRYSYHGILFNVLVILLTYWISRVWHALTAALIRACTPASSRELPQ